MRSLLKIGVAAACALAASFAGGLEARADKLADIIAKGVVRIVVFADVPPFGSQNASRELEGFDIDMAKLVAQTLGVKLELVPAPAANRIPFLLTDKADMNIEAMSITAERAKQVMFSAPYADTSLAVYGPKDKPVKTAADLGKDKISVAKGTTEDIVLSAANSSADIMRTEDNATAVQAYLSGQSQFLAANSVVVPERRFFSDTSPWNRRLAASGGGVPPRPDLWRLAVQALGITRGEEEWRRLAQLGRLESWAAEEDEASSEEFGAFSIDGPQLRLLWGCLSPLIDDVKRLPESGGYGTLTDAFCALAEEHLTMVLDASASVEAAAQWDEAHDMNQALTGVFTQLRALDRLEVRITWQEWTETFVELLERTTCALAPASCGRASRGAGGPFHGVVCSPRAVRSSRVPVRSRAWTLEHPWSRATVPGQSRIASRWSSCFASRRAKTVRAPSARLAGTRSCSAPTWSRSIS